MKKNQNTLGVSTLILVLIMLFAIWQNGQEMILNDSSINWIRISYDGESFDVEKDDDLVSILTKLRGRRIVEPKTKSVENAIEIDLTADGKRLHVVLGEDNYFYWDSELWRYFRITDKEIYQKVLILLE